MELRLNTVEKFLPAVRTAWVFSLVFCVRNRSGAWAMTSVTLALSSPIVDKPFLDNHLQNKEESIGSALLRRSPCTDGLVET